MEYTRFTLSILYAKGKKRFKKKYSFLKVKENRRISHPEEFQIIYADTPPSRSSSITPHSLSTGYVYGPLSKQYNIGRRKQSIFRVRNIANVTLVWWSWKHHQWYHEDSIYPRYDVMRKNSSLPYGLPTKNPKPQYSYEKISDRS